MNFSQRPQLRPDDNALRAKSLSPDRKRPPSGELLKTGSGPSVPISPIRRSGSPVRRQQIKQIENQFKRKRDEEQDKKNVKFNQDVEYFENSTLPSPQLKLRKMNEIDVQDSIQSLQTQIEELKSNQQNIMAKLDKILALIDH